MEGNNDFDFQPGIEKPVEEMDSDLWFIFKNGEILIEANKEEIHIPNRGKLSRYLDGMNHVHYIGSLNGRHCYAAELGEMEQLQRYLTVEGLIFRSFRSLATEAREEIFNVAGRAIQLINWDKDHKYCGGCATVMKEGQGERVKICPNCGRTYYPRISPAIIVAVLKGDEILMAHNRNFTKDVFSLIAGFVELGETLEECVEREVMEEVGIKVKNIRYFRSQPWPFPNSLMVAFTAEYDGGEICPDGIEIDEANWFKADKLPKLPSRWSIARKLIDWYKNVNDQITS